jgi:hypothetical protein
VVLVPSAQMEQHLVVPQAVLELQPLLPGQALLMQAVAAVAGLTSQHRVVRAARVAAVQAPKLVRLPPAQLIQGAVAAGQAPTTSTTGHRAARV